MLSSGAPVHSASGRESRGRRSASAFQSVLDRVHNDDDASDDVGPQAPKRQSRDDGPVLTTVTVQLDPPPVIRRKGAGPADHSHPAEHDSQISKLQPPLTAALPGVAALPPATAVPTVSAPVITPEALSAAAAQKLPEIHLDDSWQKTRPANDAPPAAPAIRQLAFSAKLAQQPVDSASAPAAPAPAAVKSIAPAQKVTEQPPSEPEPRNNTPAPANAPSNHDAAPAQPLTQAVVYSAVDSQPSPAGNASSAPAAAPPPVDIPDHRPSLPVNEISVQIAASNQVAASVRVVDRGGELRVSVRASDTQLAASLRTDVEQLASRLNSVGWNAEIWKPQKAMNERQGSPETEPAPSGQSASNQKDARERDRKQQSPEWAEEFES